MGLSRRFLNVIADRRVAVARSLFSVDLTRQQMFHPAITAAETTRAESELPQGAQDNISSWSPAMLGMESIRLDSPVFTFKPSRTQGVQFPWSIGCFPLEDRKVLCTDQAGRAFLLDPDTCDVLTMPPLHKPKSLPASIFVPSTDEHGGILFLMDIAPQPEPTSSNGQPSEQFEAFIYRKTSMTCPSKTWDCQLLPLPPYIHDPSNWGKNNSISSTAVLGGSSHICISVDGIGTYCMDTMRHTWTHVGNWKLPFHGKIEYVPELKLWFGLTADKPHRLAAADLSTLDSQPQLVGTWNDLATPEEWHERSKVQLVNLGSGRFCIARFFRATTTDDFDDDFDHYFTVMTGVEVVPSGGGSTISSTGSGGNGNIQLQMIPHKSLYHMFDSGIYIESLF